MVKKTYLTIPQLAKILGLSRIEVYRKVKKGQIRAIRAGRIYLIADHDVECILNKELTPEMKKQIDMGVAKVVREYGELLKRLGKE